MFFPGRPQRGEPASDGAEYEFPMRRAEKNFLRELRRRADGAVPATASPAGAPSSAATAEPLAPVVPLAVNPGVRAWATCERLMEESHAERLDDPEMMLCLAAAAVGAAAAADPAVRGPQALADLRARASACLGNAKRVNEDLAAAGVEFRRAREWAEQGTGDPLLAAQVAHLTASLLIHQRRFPEAHRLLDEAAFLYQSHGDVHAAGKVLLSKAVATGYEGRAEDAIGLVVQGLRLIDPEREEPMILNGLHSLLWFLADCGQYALAWSLLWRCRPLYAEEGEALHDIKLTWLEGRVARGLGNTGRAERCYRRAREAFLAHDLPYTAAVVATDLAIVLLERGAASEAHGLITGTLKTFDLLHIQREAAGALILLAEAIRQKTLTVAVLERAGRELVHLER